MAFLPLDRLLKPTRHIRPGHERTHALLAVGTSAAIVVHVIATSFFAAGGIVEMVVLNLAFSLPAYAAAFLLNRRGLPVAALALCVLELCVHQVASTVYVGTQAGLQYFLMVVPAVALSLVDRRLIVPTLLVVPALGTFVWMISLPPDRVPVHVMQHDTLALMAALSAIGTFFLLGFFAWHFASAAEQAERRNRELADEALRRSEERSAKAFDASPDIILVTRLSDGGVVDVNRRFCEATGLTREQAIGRTSLDLGLWGSAADRASCVEALRANGFVSNLPYVMVSPSTGPFDALYSGTLLLGESEPLVLSLVRDVTDQVRLRESVERSDRLASVGMLASGVAHEINNPINIVLNCASLITDASDPATENAHHAALITEAGERVAAIVRNLLAFTRKDHERPQQADIGEVVGRTVSLVRKLLERDRIAVALDVEEGLPLVSCHAGQVGQVVMNLLTNARDALNARYPQEHPDKRIRVEVGLGRLEARDAVRIAVEDRGAGVPPELRESIFSPFFTTKSRALGTGLGLSLCQTFVERHGGRIFVDSIPDVRTRFVVDLPVEGPADAATADAG